MNLMTGLDERGGTFKRKALWDQPRAAPRYVFWTVCLPVSCFLELGVEGEGEDVV